MVIIMASQYVCELLKRIGLHGAANVAGAAVRPKNHDSHWGTVRIWDAVGRIKRAGQCIEALQREIG
jgi:hypothetical protein